MAEPTPELPEIVVNPAAALETLRNWADDAFRLAPNIIVALIFVMLAWIVAKSLGGIIRKGATARQRGNLGDVLGSFARWAVFFLGLMVSMTIVLPGLNPADLVAGLGIGSVAIGFAFKDILQNWLAGVLLLIQRPFLVGDMIAVDGYEGTVERVESRATLIKTYDGRRVIIPNSALYTDSVTVITAYPVRRTEMDFGISYDDDIDQACQIMLDTVAGIEGIETDPAPQALPWSLDASWVTVKLRWWVVSDGPVIGTRVNVLKKVKSALEAAGIEIPFEIQTQLIQERTPANDPEAGKPAKVA